MGRDHAEGLCAAAGVPLRFLDDERASVEDYLRKRSGATDEGPLSVVRRVVAAEQISEDDADRLLAIPWEALCVATGAHVDEAMVRGQWLEMLRARSTRISRRA